MSTESKRFYRITCDSINCGAVLTDGEHEWWDADSIDPMMRESAWRSIGCDTLCWNHWIECDYCDKPMPCPDEMTPDRWSCTTCDLAHHRCGRDTGHQYVDEGYTNGNNDWVEVITCTLCGHVQREEVQRD